VKPTISTQYRLASGTIAAAAVRVPVASLVRLSAPQTPTPDQLSGLVRPGALAGVTVWIQRQDGEAWRTVAQTTVSADGTFLASLPVTPGAYRARVSSGRGFVAGTSQVLQVSTS